jgi:hypothetical protein
MSRIVRSLAFKSLRCVRYAFGTSTLALYLVGCGGPESGPPESAQLFLEAQRAAASGDNAAALALLQASIDAEPNVYAYMERIKLNAKQGADAVVEEDVQAILKLEPDNRDVAWIRAELKKPAAARFDAAAKPPSATK